VTQKPQTINKSLILLKSLVVGMGVVFVVLIIALVFIKQKKSQQQVKNCTDFLQLQIAGEVDKIEVQGNNIIILTKPNLKTTRQEIIKIDSNCVKVINRIELTK